MIGKKYILNTFALFFVLLIGTVLMLRNTAGGASVPYLPLAGLLLGVPAALTFFGKMKEPEEGKGAKALSWILILIPILLLAPALFAKGIFTSGNIVTDVRLFKENVEAGSAIFDFIGYPSGFTMFFYMIYPFVQLTEPVFVLVLLLPLFSFAIIGSAQTMRELLSRSILFLTLPIFFFGGMDAKFYFGFGALAVMLLTVMDTFYSSQPNEKGFSRIQLLLSAASAALVTAIFPSFLPVIALTAVFYFKQHIKQMMLFIVSFTAVLLLFAAPFLKSYGWTLDISGGSILAIPFEISGWWILGIAAAANIIGWLCSSRQELYFFSALILFSLGIIGVAATFTNGSSLQAVFSHPSLIAVFSLSLPFFIMAFRDTPVTEYAGKRAVD